MSGSKICYWAMGDVSGSAIYCRELCLAGSVVTVQCGLFQVVSFTMVVSSMGCFWWCCLLLSDVGYCWQHLLW